jgi:hypothetical protein
MGGWARVMVSGVAHPVTQRGNRRQETLYSALLSEWCGHPSDAASRNDRDGRRGAKAEG